MLRHLRQLVSESLIYGLSDVILRSITLFLVPITTRIFTPAQYGVMGIVTTTVSLLSIFVVLGLDNSTARWFYDSEEIADRKHTFASWAWCQLTVALLVGGVIFACAGPLGQALTGSPEAVPCLRWAAFTLPLTGAMGVLNRWLRFQRRAWATSLVNLSLSLLTVLLTLLLVVVLRKGIAGVFEAQALSALAGTGLVLVLMRGWLAPEHFDGARLRAMLRYSLPLVPGGLAAWSLNLADRFFVQHYHTSAEVGLYSIGSSIAVLTALVVQAFTQAWGPFAFSLHQSPNAPRIYATVFLAYVWGGCLVATAISILAPEALRLLTTRAYYGASTVVGLLAMSWVMDGLYYIAALGPSLVRQTKHIGAAVTLAAALNILLNFLLIPRWGKEGAAVATLIAYALRAIYLFARSQNLYPIPYRFGAALVLFAFSGILIGSAQAWHFGSLWTSVAAKLAGLSAFVLMLFALRIVSVGQVKSIFSAQNPAPQQT